MATIAAERLPSSPELYGGSGEGFVDADWAIRTTFTPDVLQGILKGFEGVMAFEEGGGEVPLGVTTEELRLARIETFKDALIEDADFRDYASSRSITPEGLQAARGEYKGKNLVLLDEIGTPYAIGLCNCLYMLSDPWFKAFLRDESRRDETTRGPDEEIPDYAETLTDWFKEYSVIMAHIEEYEQIPGLVEHVKLFCAEENVIFERNEFMARKGPEAYRASLARGHQSLLRKQVALSEKALYARAVRAAEDEFDAEIERARDEAAAKVKTIQDGNLNLYIQHTQALETTLFTMFGYIEGVTDNPIEEAAALRDISMSPGYKQWLTERQSRQLDQPEPSVPPAIESVDSDQERSGHFSDFISRLTAAIGEFGVPTGHTYAGEEIGSLPKRGDSEEDMALWYTCSDEIFKLADEHKIAGTALEELISDTRPELLDDPFFLSDLYLFSANSEKMGTILNDLRHDKDCKALRKANTELIQRWKENPGITVDLKAEPEE